jgi:protein-S-isoprenylcysteine O-methyltransferase Ste14
VKSIAGIALIILLLFLPAGTLDWRAGWAYVIVYVLVILATALVVDPDLMAERNQRRHADQKGWDKALFGAYGTIMGLVIPVLAGFNVRFGWKPDVSSWVQYVALATYVLGWGFHLWAMVVNRFFAQVVRIQHDRGQTVVTGGPYRWVRHPGYAFGVVLTVAGPLMLGSAWATLAGLIGAVLLIVRTALEDRVLVEELAGYKEYTQQVRWRLVPGVW